MLEVIRDEQSGNIKGVCEWYLVDINGNFDPAGKFVWVNEVEIAPQYRSNGMLKQFTRMIMEHAPTAEFAYFWRQGKYPGRKPRIYHKFQWMKLVK